MPPPPWTTGLPVPNPDVRLEAIGIRPYALPLRQPWTSAHGTRTERRGWLVQVQAAGVRGHGDCAPLPEAGTEAEAVAEGALRLWQARLPGQSLAALLDPGRQSPYGEALGVSLKTPSPHPSPSRGEGVREPADTLSEVLSEAKVGAQHVTLAGTPPGIGPTPAADFALECALTDLAARLAGVPLRRWLAPEANDRVPVNATLGTLRDQTPARVAAACQAGYRVLKLKVGLDAPETEIAHLRKLASHLPPGVSLRLDANGAWDYDQAARLIDQLNDLPIESLEEPLKFLEVPLKSTEGPPNPLKERMKSLEVPPKVPDWEALRRLQAQARFALALDESLHLPPPPMAIRDAVAPLLVDSFLSAGAPPVRRLVLKPAAVGGLRRTLFLAREATRLGLEVVLTSLIESAAGLWPSLQLAAALSSPIPQGLATSHWLAQDLGRVPDPERGHIWLGRDSGSGFIPLRSAESDASD